MCFLSVLGRIRGFFILTRDLEKKRKFFSLVLGKIREVSLPFKGDGSDIALWRISTGRRHRLLYYSATNIEWFEVAILEGFYPGFGATSNTKALAFA